MDDNNLEMKENEYDGKKRFRSGLIENPRWKSFLVPWTLVTAFGFFLHNVVSKAGLYYYLLSNLYTLFHISAHNLVVIVTFAEGIIQGLFISFGQWLILKWFFENSRWWIFATTIAYIIEKFVSLAIDRIPVTGIVNSTFFVSIVSLLGNPINSPYYPNSLQGIFILGIIRHSLGWLVIAFMQWVVLLRWVQRATYWICIFCGASLIELLFLLVNPYLGWLLFGLITGWGLKYLINKTWVKEKADLDKGIFEKDEYDEVLTSI